jgi:hypothetical protein
MIGIHSSVQPKPPFWFRPDTQTETQYLAVTFGQYRNLPKLYNLELESVIFLHATQSWFRLPLPKPGFGHTLIHRYRISFGNKFDKNKQDKKNKTDK